MPNTPHGIKVDDVMARDVASAKLPGSRDEVLEILKSKHISGSSYSKRWRTGRYRNKDRSVKTSRRGADRDPDDEKSHNDHAGKIDRGCRTIDPG